jgi:hypothetical protein
MAQHAGDGIPALLAGISALIDIIEKLSRA